MKPVIKKAKRRAGHVREAEPQFISLVDRGANNTPFTLLKRGTSNGDTEMAIKKRKTGVTKGSNTVTTSPAPDNSTSTITEVAKMVFSKAVFDTEAAVLEYVKAAEWDNNGLTVVASDNTFVVRDTALSDSDYVKISKVATEDEGVEAYVGTREVELRPETTDTPAEDAAEVVEASAAVTETSAASADTQVEEPATDDTPADEGVVTASAESATPRAKFLRIRKAASAQKATLCKFSEYDARWSNSNTLAGAIADGMEYDMAPPGYDEVSDAFEGAVRNILASDNTSGRKALLSKVSAEFADIVNSLDSYFQTVITSPAALKKSATSEFAPVYKWADGFADFINDAAAPAKASVAKAAAPTEDIQTIIAKSVADAVGPLEAAVSSVNATVETIASQRQKKRAFATDNPSDDKVAYEKSEDENTVWLRKRQESALM